MRIDRQSAIDLGLIEPQTERELHQAIDRICQTNNWLTIHSRMDRRPTIAVGAPDFLIFMPNRLLCVEAKIGRGRLSEEQQRWRARLIALGFEHYTVRTVREFRAICQPEPL